MLPNMLLRVMFLSVFSTLIAISVGRQCFGIDGSKLDNSYVPCNANAQHSGCCATKRAVGADLCLDNGLCMSTSGETTGMIWQAGCTDQTGADVACPRVCPGVSNNFGGLKAIAAWNIQQCNYGTYCCRAPNDRLSCCNNTSAPKVTTSIGALQLQAVTATPSSSSKSKSAQPSNVVATAVSKDTSRPSEDSENLNICTKEKNQTAIVGGTIGGLFGAIILGLLFVALWLYKKEKRQRRLKEHYEEQFSQTAAYRRAITSNVSIIGYELDDTKPKPDGA
ncbi:hypothetical protein ACEQ8H_003993 [Pleosporales sp. CAS-2024a]